MTQKFEIALPGEDIHTTNLNGKVLDSTYPSPKVDTLANPSHAGILFINWQSSIAVPLGSTKLIYSFPHKYDYTPACFGVFHFDNGNKIDGVMPFQYGSLGMIVLDSDQTNINVKYFSLDLASTTIVTPFIMRIRFYVMAERGYLA